MSVFWINTEKIQQGGRELIVNPHNVNNLYTGGAKLLATEYSKINFYYPNKMDLTEANGCFFYNYYIFFYL